MSMTPLTAIPATQGVYLGLMSITNLPLSVRRCCAGAGACRVPRSGDFVQGDEENMALDAPRVAGPLPPAIYVEYHLKQP